MNVWRDRDRERHPSAAAGGNRLPNPCPDRSVRHFPDPRLSCLFVYYAVPWDFQCGPPSSAYWLDVPSRRAEPAGESAARRFFLPSSRLFFSVRCFRVASCTNGYGGVSENPRVSASASLMRAPVFRQCGQQHLRRADPGRNGAGRLLQASRFKQFIMEPSTSGGVPALPDNRDGNRLSGIRAWWIGAGRCCISVFTPRGNVGQVFHNPVFSRITELVTATRPDGDKQNPSGYCFGELKIALLTQHGLRTAHRCLQIPVPAHRGHGAFPIDDDVLSLPASPSE